MLLVEQWRNSVPDIEGAGTLLSSKSEMPELISTAFGLTLTFTYAYIC